MATKEKKPDTKIGRLIDTALKYRYGDNFEWSKIVVEKDHENDTYIVKIEPKPEIPYQIKRCDETNG